jgi:bifunctional non-homologous end joining protein LigD
MGYFDDRHRLVYAGRVGTGFNDKLLRSLHRQLQKLRLADPPTADPPPARIRRTAHWVRPVLVAEVRFTEWTRDGLLRHPAFVALRSDKPASQVVREVPAG